MFPELQNLFTQMGIDRGKTSRSTRYSGTLQIPEFEFALLTLEDEAATGRSLNSLHQRHAARADPRSWPPVNPRVRRGRTSPAGSGGNYIHSSRLGRANLVQSAGPGSFLTHLVSTPCSRASDAGLTEKVKLATWDSKP